MDFCLYDAALMLRKCSHCVKAFDKNGENNQSQQWLLRWNWILASHSLVQVCYMHLRFGIHKKQSWIKWKFFQNRVLELVTPERSCCHRFIKMTTLHENRCFWKSKIFLSLKNLPTNVSVTTSTNSSLVIKPRTRVYNTTSPLLTKRTSWHFLSRFFSAGRPNLVERYWRNTKFKFNWNHVCSQKKSQMCFEIIPL